jgi:hypothetical protein
MISGIDVKLKIFKNNYLIQILNSIKKINQKLNL